MKFLKVWTLLIILLPCSLSSSPYQLYNYTWQIINQAGDVANSTSQLSTSTPWPPLEVDLCALALGADPQWGTPDHFWPQNKPINTGNRYLPQYGCGNTVDRTLLNTAPIYVCPGPSHRPRTSNYCGYYNDYFCASWGCETTGDGSWRPYSSWDYITIKRKSPIEEKDLAHHVVGGQLIVLPQERCNNWCNPILISFTEKGKRAKWENNRGLEWGLRLYVSGKDIGLTFKIKLTKTLPDSQKASIGPNPVLHNPQSPAQPEPPQQSLPSTSPTAAASTFFRPTVPPRSPSSADLILTLINSSIQVFNSVNHALGECWICYSSSPPFYEGLAASGKVTFTNETSGLRWRPPPGTQGLTMSFVSGAGLCLVGPHMLPPTSLQEICNQTLTIDSKSYTYALAPSDAYLACSTGLTTYIEITTFLDKKDYCVLINLLPRLTIRNSDDFQRMWNPDLSAPSRNKREPITTLTLALITGLGVAGAGTGVASLVTSNQQYAQLSLAIDKDLQELQSGMQNLKDSVSSLSEVVLQNRRGLDLLFLQQGGLCAALKEECCFYADKTGLVENSLQKVRGSLEQRKRERQQNQSWYESWFTRSPWMTTLISTLLGPLIILILLFTFGPCIINRLVTFIRERISTVQVMILKQQYQSLAETEIP